MMTQRQHTQIQSEQWLQPIGCNGFNVKNRVMSFSKRIDYQYIGPCNNKLR
jgi:hypothetical protein